MKKIPLLLVVMIFFSSTCSAQTQTELNQDAEKSYKEIDKKLNEVYQKILKLYSKNTSFLDNLKTAQKIWILFRDAQFAVKYPERSNGSYGSTLPMCQSAYLAELTNKRVNELEDWLVKPVEGDICSGTIGEYEIKSK